VRSRRRFVNLPSHDGEKPERVMVVKRGKVYGMIVTWTDCCSGCTELVDGQDVYGAYRYDSKAGCLVGSGCHECGYHGKVRNGSWVALPMETQRQLISMEKESVERNTK
jgi:hypothetical protein